MSSFKDFSGREWQLRIDTTVIRRVRDKHGIDLAKILSSQTELNRLADDVVLLVDVLYAICEPQANTRQIDAESFAIGLSGDSIESATHALMEAIIDFFPQCRSKILRQLWGKILESESKAIANAEDLISKLTF